MLKHGFFAVAFGLMVWLLLDYQAVDRDNTLTIGGPFEFTSQDLAKDGYIYTRLQVAESLVEVQPDGTLAPKLAQSWNVSDDGLVWQFTLRDDVFFHDLQPMTASTVVNAIEQALEKPGVIRQLPLKSISGVGHTVTLELEQPFRPLLSIMAHYSLAILSPGSYDGDGNVVDIHGTGPYQVAVLAPPHKLNVARFGEYYGDLPEIEQLHYLTGHRAESRALQAESGQADLIYTLDPASLDMLHRSEQVDVVSESIPRTVVIKLNNQHRFLDTKEVRQALSLALDREGISSHIVRVPDSQAYQLFPPALGDWHLSDIEHQNRNLELAQELLSAQGWHRTGSGVLEREGERFELNMVTYADRPELTVIATAIQAQLREVGVDVSISVDNSSAIPARHHDGSLELALVARNFGTIADPLAILLEDTASHKGSDWGHMNWSSASLNDMFAQMMTAQGKDYTSLSQQAAAILAQEMPLIPVVFYTQQVAVNKRVNNFVFDPFENNYRASEMSFAD
ncbi:ABC transporter substrate-binding protein [Vibrio agarivorans]|uniref:ABC transporter substrate-binding protein n=1 Tax=Vibrio agarivorans TaxID=153622 RepID=UPI002230AAB9|nr:ABC transporter substrate-binding protein [Vibrio agarivorans]